MIQTARRPVIEDERPDLVLIDEADDRDDLAAGLDLQHDIVVRLTPAVRWVPAIATYLGPTEPRIVLDRAPLDEE